MIDPALAFQTAIRATLLASPGVAVHVEPDNIRAGATWPDRTPAILLADARTEYLGVASGSQRLARVTLNLHIWAVEDGPATAHQIGAAVHHALEFGPKDNDEITVDDWSRPSMVWLRYPQPEVAFTHGVMALEAVVRWRVAA